MLRLARDAISGPQVYTLAVALPSYIVIAHRHDYLIIVPVFNVRDGWSAAKIATAKLQAVKAKLVSCIPYKNDYICVFCSTVEPDTKFPVYRASSDRRDR